MNLLLGSSFVAWLAAVLYPAVRFLQPVPLALGGGPLELAPEDLDTLRQKQFVIVRLAGKKVIVFQGPSRLRALSAKCTHEGCTVQYMPKKVHVFCACHSGIFDLDGRVLAGPPPRPLARYDVAGDLEGGVVVSPREA